MRATGERSAEQEASLARLVRRMAAIVAVVDLVIVAVTVAFSRDAYVLSAAGISALVAVAYLLRMTRGDFDPYGSISLASWTLVSATLFPGSIPGQGLCVGGMVFVLASCISSSLATRRYEKFTKRAIDLRA